MSALVEGKTLSKWYGQVVALNNVTFTIGQGVVGLLGPNGAGKSTLMKLITGQLRPSQGEITVFGERIWNNFPLFHRMGFCPEQDSFYERMTGAEFLSALLHMHPFGDAEVAKRVEQCAGNGQFILRPGQENCGLQQGDETAYQVGTGDRPRSGCHGFG